MKVYFEYDGGGGGKTWINVYVDPTDDGHGYWFTAEGKKTKFAWVHPSEATVFDSSELPEDLWYSIQHGVHHLEVDSSKSKGWTWDDLEYTKVSKEETAAYLEACNKIKEVTTIEDFKALYPIIRKGRRVNHSIMDKLLDLRGISDVPVHNGEIGIAFYQKMCIYKAILIELGLEKKEDL